MRRLVALAVVTALGAVAGVTTGTALLGSTPPAPRASSAEPEPDSVLGAPETPGHEILLVWSPDPVPETLPEALARHPAVDALSVVRTGLVNLVAGVDATGRSPRSPPPGMVIALEVMAFDPHTLGPFLPGSVRAQFTGLTAPGVLLGETAAQLRQLGKGGRLELDDGSVLAVTGTVDDVSIGGYELAVPLTMANDLDLTQDRYLLVAHRGDRTGVERAARGAVDGALRIRAVGETPFLRHGDAVLPQAFIKQLFGEFAHRPGPGTELVIDPAWEAEHLVTTDVPLLGRLRCHRSLLPALVGAMRELRDANLGYLVDPAGFGGCWNPRLIAPDAGISRHAWGVALDINTTKNPTGLESTQDPRLVATMERWGFTWGGAWLHPDPAHFEYLRPPSPRADDS